MDQAGKAHKRKDSSSNVIRRDVLGGSLKTALGLGILGLGVPVEASKSRTSSSSRPSFNNKTAERYPNFPPRDQIPASELPAYDYSVELVEALRGWPDKIDGMSWGVGATQALAMSPVAFLALRSIGDELKRNNGKPGFITDADQEMVSQVLGVDSGYYAVIALLHTAQALRAGIPIDTIEALADGREDKLTEIERQQVEFIRAVRDGTMTDEIWHRTLQRVGSERGVVEYAYRILTVLFWYKMSIAVGVPSPTLQQYKAMLRDYRTGKRSYKEDLTTISSQPRVNAFMQEKSCVNK